MSPGPEKPSGLAHGPRRAGSLAPLYFGLVLLAVAVAVFLALVWVPPATSLCIPPGESIGPGQRMCPVPPPPSPTTIIAGGAVYIVLPGGMSAVQFNPSSATFAILNGSFRATSPVSILVMTPDDFETFSAMGAAKYVCSQTNDCFQTGNISSGWMNLSVPVYVSPNGGSGTLPWFLVMQNFNATQFTIVTWTMGLSATYVDVYAGLSVAGTVHGEPQSLPQSTR